MISKIFIIIALLAYITFITLIIVGGAFITNILYKLNEDELSNIGLNTTTKINIAKMTIVIFWITFLPLCIAPLVFCGGYCKYIF